MLTEETPHRKTNALPRLVASVLALTSIPFDAIAQEQPQGFSIGVGVAGGPGLYVGEDADAMALPLLRYDSDAFSIGVPDGLRVTLLDRNDFRLSAVIAPRFSEIDASDAPELDGLDRELTADGGIQAIYRFGDLTSLRFQAVTELTDEHGGSEVSLDLSHAIPLGRVPLLLKGGVTWQSEGLSSYLYGVSASEATGARPAYSPGDVVVPHFSVGTAIPVARNTRLIASIRADFLPDEVSSSPIVDEDVTLRGFFGITHNF
ncbi:MAG: MipA/OmpV family protein [Pseudomonadota bacterium]